MKKIKFIYIISTVCILLLNSCNSSQEENIQESQKAVDFEVNLGGINRAERFLGTSDEIKKLTLDVLRIYGNREIVKGFELTQEENSGKWEGTLNNLIVGFDYEITGHAYKIDDDNSTFIEIFTGSTNHNVTEGTNILSIRMAPILDERELTVPRITRINRPFQMEKSDNASIQISLTNPDKEPLQYRFRSIDKDTLMSLDAGLGGVFTPASGVHSDDNGTYGLIESTYTSPNLVSKQLIQVRVSNDLNIGVTSTIDIYVTGETESDTSINTNPVIESISGERLDNSTIEWTVQISDDDPFTELIATFEYMFGEFRSFGTTNYKSGSSDSSSGTGEVKVVMNDYDDLDDGMLLLTICEGGSNHLGSCNYGQIGSTSMSFELIPYAYSQPMIVDTNDFETGSVSHNDSPSSDDSSDNFTHFVFNTVDPRKNNYDTFIILLNDCLEEDRTSQININCSGDKFINDDIDNDVDDYGKPYDYESFEDSLYQNEYHFEQSFIDVGMDNISQSNFSRIIISTFSNYEKLKQVYNGDNKTLEYEGGGMFRIWINLL